jgi:hypothetical protein
MWNFREVKIRSLTKAGGNFDNIPTAEVNIVTKPAWWGY